MANFDIAVQLVLQQEGGYVNNPNDPGGETHFGISKRSYPNLNIKDLTKEQAIEIYKKDFWRFDGINDQRLANLLFSSSVNNGLLTAIFLLQQSLALPSDRVWGPLTESTANNNPDTLFEFASRLVQYYIVISFRTDYAYLHGWINRIIKSLI